MTTSTALPVAMSATSAFCRTLSSEESDQQVPQYYYGRITGSFIDDKEYAESPARTVEKSPTPVKSAPSALNPKRRLEGFIVEVEGEKTKVALLENGVLHYYRFATNKLSKKHITEKNQPFEMSEYEVVVDGDPHCIYVFKPLAKKSDKRKRPIPLDAERKAKLNFILRGGKDADV